MRASGRYQIRPIGSGYGSSPRICIGAIIIYYIYINSLDVNIDNARFHFYADDTVIYCSAPTKQQALVDLQSVFDIIQARFFFTLKLVLNVEKTKCMWLSNSRNSLDGSVVLRTLQGKLIALVSEYKYLGIKLMTNYALIDILIICD